MSTCLVVDDSRTVRKLIKATLDKLYLKSREAENGQEALDACAEEMPDVILLDWNMPVMDGLEFLREIRAQEHARQPKIIFCTTECDLSSIEEAMQCGANEYIMKPFDQDILVSKLRLVGAM